MTRRTVSIGSEASLVEAARRMSEENVGCLLVIDDGKLVGMLTDRDIVTRAVLERKDLEKCKVGDYMTKEVVTAIPETDVLEAVKIMNRYQVRRLPVVEGGKDVVGIVSIADVAAYAESILGEVAKMRKR
ncbi:MAG: CBS domain-containing protein [Actinomycetota bacterium]|nr:CBS domain-containing protein [Actinomycetota bacterium]